MLQPNRFPEFDGHALVVPIADKKSGLRGFIAIHRDGGTSLGATRLWRYDSETDALRDALRLSRLMSYKSAVAGLNYGGAKAALMLPPGGIKDRKLFFETYASFVDSLNGQFVTGTDVGVTDEDVRVMRRKTPFVIGSKVDPAYYTAVGIVGGIEVALQHVFGSPSIKGRSFAIQGIGKVGGNVVAMLYREAQKIYVADTDTAKVSALKKKFPRIIAVPSSLILEQSVDVVVPCALSGALNRRSITKLKCRIVAGSANNQLARDHRKPDVGTLLHRRGILYAPDYVVNVGGFVSVVDEFVHGKPAKQRILKKIGNMKKALTAIFDASAEMNEAPDAVADRIAESLMEKSAVRRTAAI